MTSAFESLVGPGRPLRVEQPDANEFEGLKRSAGARLRDAMGRVTALSPIR